MQRSLLDRMDVGMGIDRRKVIQTALASGVGVALVTQQDALAEGQSPDDYQSGIVGQQNDVFFHNQPPPVYDYSAPRDVMRQLYDALVPRMANTWTVFYVQGIGAVDVTPSKGYPIPFGSQLTSPEYLKTNNGSRDGHDSQALPQPEPDGLYRSGETSATWVLAINDDGFVIPEYHEEIVACYPFPVTIDPNTKMIVRDSKASTVVVDISRAAN